MDLINPLLLILAGIMAISGLIVAKKPNAKELLDKLVPYQAFIGIALLAIGLYHFIRSLRFLGAMVSTFPGIVWLAVIVCSILLGFMFGMPQIAKWMPGEGGAEQKGMELAKKLAPYQVVLGLVGIGAGLLALLYRWGIL